MAYGELKVDKLSGMSAAGVNDFRLTLTTGTPVTTADVSAAGTIYMTPYKGNSIGCYDGTNWQMVQTTELSVAASTTGTKVFDIFLDYNAGTPQLVTTDWTNDTTRATALVYQDGVLVQTGNTDWRYLGTARTKTASQVDDAKAFRHLWNYYNRVTRTLRITDATSSWTYNSATIRQTRASTANQVDLVIGVDEDTVSVFAAGKAQNSIQGQSHATLIGLDSTTTYATDSLSSGNRAVVANQYTELKAEFTGLVGIGRHYLVWLERGSASGTGTFYGNGSSGYKGLIGSMRA
jgi:hypothetical protein